MFDIEVMNEEEKLDFIQSLTRTALITDIAMLCGFGLCYLPFNPLRFYLHGTPNTMGYTGI